MPHTPARCIAVFAKHGSKVNHPIWSDVADLLLAHHFRVLVCDSVLPKGSKHPDHRYQKYEFASIDTIRKQADYAVTIGGDGTFLGVARELTQCNIPLIGINLGRLGFLTDILLTDINPTLIDTLTHLPHMESRQYLQGQVVRNGEVLAEHIALNDIVISRGIIGGMVDLHVQVDGHVMYNLRADGLILSTPTGSTAYALSADGPILHPALAGLVLVPVAPHTLTNRPIVLPGHCNIEITITGGKQAAVHFDMQGNNRIKQGDQIRVQVAPKPIQLLHPARYDYFAMLRQKLHWSTSPTELVSQHRELGENNHHA